MSTRMPIHVVLMLVLFCAGMLSVNTVSAQFSLGGSGISLEVNPQNPKPGTVTTVTLDDYSVNTIGADILWFVNGVEQKEFQNDRSMKVEVGGLGEKVAVRVSLIREGGFSLTKTVEIVPSQVDIIIESKTYVPDFYRGKALPSADSTIRAVAVVHDGSSVPDTAYTYRWSEDGEILFGGPLKGKNSIELSMSQYRDRKLSVTVLNTEGKTVGSGSVVLNAKQPVLHFYEYSPLRGLLEKAMRPELPLLGEEMTVRGEPYYLNSGRSLPDTTVTWEIDGRETAGDAESKNAITLRHEGGEGRGEINLTVINNTRIPQVVRKGFLVFFE